MKPILGEYLLEAMDSREGLVARHDTHRVAHDLLQLMMELSEIAGDDAAAGAVTDFSNRRSGSCTCIMST